MSDEPVREVAPEDEDPFRISPGALRGFMETEEGKLLLASRNYDAIIGSRMTMDDLIRLNGGKLR